MSRKGFPFCGILQDVWQVSVSEGRVLVPEILDSLPPEDPEAVRGRKDLLALDRFLGNSRWIVRSLAPEAGGRMDLAELGAGDGLLCTRLATTFQEAEVTGYDLNPRPRKLPENVHWVEGDLFERLQDHEVAVGALVLHHFADEALIRLGEGLRKCRRLVFAEPLRNRPTVLLSQFALPFVGSATRHDMPASIHAGFLRGEIGHLLQLDGWQIEETEDWRGTLRFHAWRNT